MNERQPRAHRQRMKRRIGPAIVKLCLLALVSGGAQGGETHDAQSPSLGATTWETETDKVRLRMTQVMPDQVRAFMVARGLDEKSVGEFANHCVFVTELRNESKFPITYCMAEWRYVTQDGRPQVMLTKHDWLARFQFRHLTAPARLAFEWSQFPVEQTFFPGDWNEGMTTFDLPPGSTFDLVYRWMQGKTRHEGIVKNVECAALSAGP